MLSLLERISTWMLPKARTPVVAMGLVTATVAVAGAGAASALAGQYHVYSCRTPSGEVAPADGWSGAVAVDGEADDYAVETCAQGGALIAALGDQTSHIANTDYADWSFETPLWSRLAGATLWRAGYLHGTAGEETTYQLWMDGPVATEIFERCLYTLGCPSLGVPGEPMSVANRVVVPTANLGAHLEVNVACASAEINAHCPGRFGDPNGYAAVVYVYAADLILEQVAGPTASNVSGELASAATVSGTSDLAFSASDPGSGVYEAVFSVDGQVVQRTVVDEDGGRCRNVGETTDGLPAFLYVQPCPASVNADVGLETTRIANGTHHLVVSVIDAAGNAATVLDRSITVENAQQLGGQPGAQSEGVGGPNGTNASAQATLTVGWKGAKGKRLTSDYGHAQTIVGRLTGAGGVPIEGAHVDVLATPAYVGARVAAMASSLTGAGGRFSVRLPAGVSSSTLRVSYSDRVGMAPVATRTLTLSVRAGVTLSIAPRTASVGRSVYFSGRLRGGPVPSGGKLLVLEARSPGGAWLEFDVIRTDSRGRYHASYRFKFPGPASYQFRVLCEAEADYPFATGASPVVGVFEY
jgi:hypothetical protein